MTNGWSGAWHPLAERFPMLAEDELRELADSIRAHGQLVPCIRTPDGLGLDGRNRVAACALAGVDAAFDVYDGDPVAFIVAVNAERRHLTTGQRAIAVAIGLADAGLRADGSFKRGSVPGDSRRSSVSDGSWRDKVTHAGVVLDHAPELVDGVLAGELALDTAYRDAAERKRRREKIKGELAALVDAGVIDLAEAERRADEELRLGQLTANLADRVRAGTLAIDEAEAIDAERRERNAAAIARVRDALNVLTPMAGKPVPAELTDELTGDERLALAAVLTVLAERSEQA